MNFFPDDLSNLAQLLTSTIIGYFTILIAIRLVGLRSLAKMASHDFAVTVAIGSILASAALASNTPILVPVLAVAVLFSLQYTLSRLLGWSDRAQDLISNQPVLLMAGADILHDNLESVRVSEDELFAKLREANVTDLRQVMAVVFESTGDVSVLHGPPEEKLDPALLKNVAPDKGIQAS